MTRLLLLVPLAAALLGCGAEQSAHSQNANAVSAPFPSIPVDANAGPSGMDTLTWFHDSNGRDGRLRLMYSAHGSDEMALNLQCDDDGVDALILRMAPQDQTVAAWPFTLISGDQRTVLNGAVEASEDGQLFITALTPTTDPTLTRLRDTGELSLEDSEGAHVFNAIDDQERTAIRDFFAACAR